jgi:NitT/TauT family transport system substrate-binding protein
MAGNTYHSPAGAVAGEVLAVGRPGAGAKSVQNEEGEMRVRRVRARLGVTVIGALVASLVLVACGPAGETGGGGASGEPGDPVTLTVGYQPFYTESWSGVVMRDKELWKKHLPEGSQVNFQVGLQGSIIVSQMLAGKQQIGYTGDMPGIVAVTKRPTRDLRIVAVLGFGQDQCNIFLTKKDAPSFDDPKRAVQWMNGKKVSSPQGSCTDRFTQAVFEAQNVKPSSYLNQSIEVIATNFEQGKIDAASIWEPNASRLVNEGIATRVASGVNFDRNDAGLLVMSQELKEKRPDIAEGWLKAELEAQRFLADPKNAMEIAQMAKKQTTGFELKDLWDSLYKDWPVEKGGNPEDVKFTLPFAMNDDVQTLVDRSVQFLNEIKTINTKELPPGAVDDSIARKVLQEAGLEDAGEVKALPESEFKGA